jgi:hypothetical protein
MLFQAPVSVLRYNILLRLQLSTTYGTIVMIVNEWACGCTIVLWRFACTFNQMCHRSFLSCRAPLLISCHFILSLWNCIGIALWAALALCTNYIWRYGLSVYECVHLLLHSYGQAKLSQDLLDKTTVREACFQRLKYSKRGIATAPSKQ